MYGKQHLGWTEEGEVGKAAERRVPHSQTRRRTKRKPSFTALNDDSAVLAGR